MLDKLLTSDQLEIINQLGLEDQISVILTKLKSDLIDAENASIQIKSLIENASFEPAVDWIDDTEGLERFVSWIKGETGYSLVDACMNQLSGFGWMHNRGRMLVGSILTKNLGVDWRWGQEYFRIGLIDLDEASNNGGWQWAASTGADPKPIRIFNPYTQNEKFDSQNLYKNQWLPKAYPPKSIQKNSLFEEGEGDLKPVVDHKKARQEALNRYGLK